MALDLTRVFQLLLENRDEEAREEFHRQMVAEGARIYRQLMEADDSLADRMVDDEDAGMPTDGDGGDGGLDDSEIDALLAELEKDDDESGDAGEVDGEEDAETGDGDGDESDELTLGSLADLVDELSREVKEIEGKVETLWDVEDEEHGGLPEPGTTDAEEEDGPAAMAGTHAAMDECAKCGGMHDRTMAAEDHDDVDAFDDALASAEGREPMGEAHDDGDEEVATADEVMAALDQLEKELKALAAEGDEGGLGENVEMDRVDFTPDPNREIGAGPAVRVNDRSPLPQRPAHRRTDVDPALGSVPDSIEGFDWERPKVPIGKAYEGGTNMHRSAKTVYGAAPKDGDPDALLNHPIEQGDGTSPIPGRGRKARRRRRG